MRRVGLDAGRAPGGSDGRTERGAALHIPIRCHCDHWGDPGQTADGRRQTAGRQQAADSRQQTANWPRGGQRRLMYRVVSRAGGVGEGVGGCRARGRAGHKTRAQSRAGRRQGQRRRRWVRDGCGCGCGGCAGRAGAARGRAGEAAGEATTHTVHTMRAMRAMRRAMLRASEVGFMRDGPLGSQSWWAVGGQGGRDALQSSGQEALREGYLRRHHGTRTPLHRRSSGVALACLWRPFADAGLLLVHSCVPEQRQPEAAGSTCWCFWEPPAH